MRFLTTVARPSGRTSRRASSTDAKPAVAARAFLADHGSLFGIDNQARELRTERTKVEAHGRSFVRFQQVHEGVPVMGGELVVQLDGQGNTVATTGEVLPDAHARRRARRRGADRAAACARPRREGARRRRGRA